VRERERERERREGEGMLVIPNFVLVLFGIGVDHVVLGTRAPVRVGPLMNVSEITFPVSSTFRVSYFFCLFIFLISDLDLTPLDARVGPTISARKRERNELC
jgi:hypothetical protein